MNNISDSSSLNQMSMIELNNDSSYIDQTTNNISSTLSDNNISTNIVDLHTDRRADNALSELPNDDIQRVANFIATVTSNATNTIIGSTTEVDVDVDIDEDIDEVIDEDIYEDEDIDEEIDEDEEIDDDVGSNVNFGSGIESDSDIYSNSEDNIDNDPIDLIPNADDHLDSVINYEHDPDLNTEPPDFLSNLNISNNLSSDISSRLNKLQLKRLKANSHCMSENELMAKEDLIDQTRPGCLFIKDKNDCYIKSFQSILEFKDPSDLHLYTVFDLLDKINQDIQIFPIAFYKGKLITENQFLDSFTKKIIIFSINFKSCSGANFSDQVLNLITNISGDNPFSNNNLSTNLSNSISNLSNSLSNNLANLANTEREKYKNEIDIMKNMGLTDETKIIQCLIVCNGNVEQSVNLYFSDTFNVSS